MASNARPVSGVVQAHRDIWIDAQMSTPAIGANVVSQFLAVINATTQGVDVSFSITDATGMASLSLVRASVMDVAQATVLQTWTASASSFTWSDTDKVLQTVGQAFYWLKLEPVNTTGAEVVVGPQYILLNPSLLPPLKLKGLSASHAAAVNGAVLVTCNIAGIDAADADSVLITATGYQGSASPVWVAEKASTPIQFNLEATGETITLTAIALSSGGAHASTGPTCTLTLNGTATAPAKPEGIVVTQISSGNQVNWPASAEAGITGYQLWVGNRGDIFANATLLATIAATGEGSVEYLDAAGLGGDFQYFVIAVAAAGNSVQSDPANPQIMFSSALVPANTSSNAANNATLDSIDAGSSATVRIYGGGGVGTAYAKLAGYGSPSRPAGSITGLAYNTRYYIIYQGGVYLATTSYAATLPDGSEWVGTLITCPSGFSGAGGATATIQALSISPYTLLAIVPGLPGYGIGSATCTVTGGGGSGSGTAICSGGSIQGWTNVTGSGFTSPGSATVNIAVTSVYTGGGAANAGSRYVQTS
jgi:hypothetical protein